MNPRPCRRREIPGEVHRTRLSALIDPLSLSFRPVEIAALAGSVVFTTIVLFSGQSSRARGALLLSAYGVVVVAFFLAGDR